MTMPVERTRALRWGWELLSTMQERPGIPEDLRARAAAIERAYPTPAAVLRWIQDDIPRLPNETALCIDAAGSLFTDLRNMTDLGDDLRRELLVVLRHYPSPVEVRAAAQSFFLGIGSWLATES
jgi:hypothetical protein